MRNRNLWIMIGLYGLFNAIKPLFMASALSMLVPLITISVPVIFALIHGPRRIGWPRVWLMFGLTVVISWCYESLSIASGFPFGNYHYTDLMGPDLGTVPALIMPAYFGVAYVAYLMAEILTGTDRAGRQPVLALTLLASSIMVFWDLSMDPSRSTVGQDWIWLDGGAYFGVPFSNFLGWFLCVGTIFLAYGLIAPRLSRPEPQPDSRADALPVGVYIAVFAEFAAYPFWSHPGTVTDAAGQVWNQSDLFQSLGLVSIFTMGFVSLLCLIRLRAERDA